MSSICLYVLVLCWSHDWRLTMLSFSMSDQYDDGWHPEKLVIRDKLV